MLQRLIPSVPCRPGEEMMNLNDHYAKCGDILRIHWQTASLLMDIE